MSQKAVVVEHFDRFAGEDRWSQLYDEFRDPLAAHSFLMRKRRVEELSEPLVGPGTRVLDAGCGTGISAPFYLEKGCVYHGVDIAQKMIEQARARLSDFGFRISDLGFQNPIRNPQSAIRNLSVTFSVADVEAGLPFPDGAFDLVIALGLLEYLDRLDAALDEMVRVTRPGGSLILTVPNRNCANYFATRVLGPVVSRAWWLVKRLLRRPAERHEVRHRRFTAARLARQLAQHGCEKTGEAYYNVEVLFYPLQRLLPGLAYAVKRRAESRWRPQAGGLCHRGWRRLFATGYILRCRKLPTGGSG
ncbi:MAG: class I SAM-dependent methyltransferase [Planctomycetes bacterium]|nr:class I SAM-dependent methyltransferase [Planctomycetota bacterium]